MNLKLLITKLYLSFLLIGLSLLAGWNKLSAQESDTLRYNQYGVPVSRIPLWVELRGGILVFESADQTHRVWYDARVQFDGAVFAGEKYNDIGNGVSIRRARLAMKTLFQKQWYAEIDLDFANSQLELKDAYLMYLPNDQWFVKAGNFKEAFSIESTTTSRYLTFIERPNVVSAFAPSRHLGMALGFRRGWFLGIAGLHFQDIGGLEERTVSEDKNKDFGTDEGYSFTGKAVIMPFTGKSGYGLHFGAAASYRTPTTDSEITGGIRYSTRSLSSINRKRYLDTDVITHVHHYLLSGFEWAGYYKNFRFQGEYMMSDVSRKYNLGDEHFNGFYVMASCMLFGGNYRYNPAEGEFTQPGRGRTWGDIELAARYDFTDLNSRMESVMGGAGEGYTAGINFYVNDNIKLMLNYAFLNHDRYANGKGKLNVGTDSQGQLTANPRDVTEAEGEAGNDFHMVSLRIEVDF